MQDLSSSSQGLNPCPLDWKRRVLTTWPPGKSHEINFNNIYHPISRVLFQLAINIKLTGTLNVSVLGLGNLVCVCWGHWLWMGRTRRLPFQTLQVMWSFLHLSQRCGSSVGDCRKASVVKRTLFPSHVHFVPTLCPPLVFVQAGIAVVLKQFAGASSLLTDCSWNQSLMVKMFKTKVLDVFSSLIS